MTDGGEPGLTEQDRRPGVLLAVGAVVLALVVGLVVGFVVGGGTSRDSSVAAVATSPEPTPTSPPATREPVPQSCAKAGAAGAAVLAQLHEAVEAIAALDPAALRQIVAALEPIQRDLEDAVARCQGS